MDPDSIDPLFYQVGGFVIGILTLLIPIILII